MYQRQNNIRNQKALEWQRRKQLHELIQQQKRENGVCEIVFIALGVIFAAVVGTMFWFTFREAMHVIGAAL